MNDSAAAHRSPDTPSLWRVWVDTGGTFTDCLAVDAAGRLHRAKVLSTSALRGRVAEALDAARLRVAAEWTGAGEAVVGCEFHLLGGGGAGVRVRALEAGVLHLDAPLPARPPAGAAFELRSPEEAPVLAARMVTRTPAGRPLPPLAMRLATTRGTNALLERRGSAPALFITRGFRDLLRIGDQQRPDLFALDVRRPEPLFASVVEVPERLAADGGVLVPLDTGALGAVADQLVKRGVRTAAVALMHAHRNPDHEQRLADLLRVAGFEHVSTSAALAPSIRLLHRAETAVVDAYLAPVIGDYLDGVAGALGAVPEANGAEHPSGAGADAGGSTLHVMTSAGGLVRSGAFRARDSLLSGPAGGVVGAARAGRAAGFERLIAFDMGGTSTDVARVEADFEYVWEHRSAARAWSRPRWRSRPSRRAVAPSVCWTPRGCGSGRRAPAPRRGPPATAPAGR
jgi:5-oxoprolinase (ATP-hydrolysing)